MVAHNGPTHRFCDWSIKSSTPILLNFESQLPTVQNRFLWRTDGFCAILRMKQKIYKTLQRLIQRSLFTHTIFHAITEVLLHQPGVRF